MGQEPDQLIFLDSSVLVELPHVALPREVVALSAITYAELAFGVEATPDPAEKARRSAHLRLVTSLGPRWLPFDTVAAEGYAEIAAAIHRRRPAHARSRDALLAGHARALGASIATFNAGDFELVRDLVPIVEPRRLA